MARYSPCRYALLRYLPASIQMGVQTGKEFEWMGSGLWRDSGDRQRAG